MLAIDGATLSSILGTLLTGTAAVITAAGGVLVVTKEGRKRERKAHAQQRRRESAEIDAYREDHLSEITYTYALRKIIVEAGLECPAPPVSKVNEYLDKIASDELQ